MSLPRGIGAVCWDLDGLLVDSEPLHFEAQRRVLARRGKTYTFEDKLAVTGGRVRDSVRKAAERYGLTDVDAMYRERMAIFSDLMGEALRLRQGARELLGRLKGRHVPCAIVTSGERDYATAVLDRFNLGHFFRVMVAAEDVRQPKPHPEPYQRAAAQLRLDPERCLALEDSRAGLLSAHDAGMAVFVIPNALTMHQDFSLADALFDSLEDIDDSVLDHILEAP